MSVTTAGEILRSTLGRLRKAGQNKIDQAFIGSDAKGKNVKNYTSGRQKGECC
jgi:hypothetical protein